MTKDLKLLAAFLLGFAALSTQPVLAQETGGETEATEEAAEEAEAGDLDLGTEVTEEDQIGQLYTRETHGDWEIRCVRTESEDGDPCQMNQILTDGEGNAVSEISMFILPESQAPALAGATIAVPLLTLLTEDVRIAVDDGNARGYKFTWCDPEGCYARIGLRAEEINAFKAGNGATVAIVPVAAPDQTVTLPLSLTGFTAAFNALSTP